MPRPRIAESMADAVAAIPDGSTIIIPGFGGAGFPWNLLTALYHQGTRDLTLVTNSLNIASANPEAKAITDMVTDGRVRKVIASFTASTHPSRASLPEQMARDGRLEVELVPQGTLAERIRSGGAGIPAFWTPAGVGTMLAEGKEHRDFEGETYILEDAIFADYALVRAHRGDTAGNLLFRRAARNFNPIAGMAARHTIAEVEQPIERAECMAYEALAAPELDVAMALRLLDDALAARRARYGEAHPSESPLRRLIAHVYAQQGDGAAARRIYEEELRRHRVAFGARHPTSLDLDFDLALLDQEQGRYDDAMRRLEEVSEGFEAIYGDTPRLAEPLMVMAMVEAAQGNVAQAVARADRAAELQAELPLDHPESGSALTLAAAIAQAGGDLPRALEAYERLAALRGARATSEQTLVWHNVAYYRCVLSSCERATEALDRVDRQTLSDSGASVRLNVDIVYGLVALSQGDDVYARNYAERVLRGLDEEGVVEPKAFEAEALWILARAARLTGDEQAALQHAVAGLRAAEGLDATIDVLRRLDEDLYARAELVLRDAAIP